VTIERAARSIEALNHQVQMNHTAMMLEATRTVEQVGFAVEKMGETLLRELDSRQLESHLTPSGMRDVASDVFVKGIETTNTRMEQVLCQLEAIKGMVEPSRQVAVSSPAVPAPVEPESFVLPTDGHTPAMAWNLYIIGNPAVGIPPLKQVTLKDCPKTCYKRMSEYLKLMKLIANEVKAKNAWVDKSDAQSAVAMFAVGQSVLTLRGHRPDEKAWTSVAKDLRGKKSGKKKMRTMSQRKATRRDEEVDDPEDKDNDIVDARRPPRKKGAKAANTAAATAK